MSSKDNHEKTGAFYGTAAAVAGILILAAAEWLCHRRVPFMMDDLWYATNLKTDQPLQGLGDILESQLWHFMNWGGRCVTHGILQMTLMSGEFAADILNMAATFLLGWMVCVTAGWRKPFCFLCASSLIVALNANVKMSMFWQAGAANYLYITVFILLFVWCYLRELPDEGGFLSGSPSPGGSSPGSSFSDGKAPEGKRLPGITLWIIPLGILAGWSNENMGPAVWVLSLAVILLGIREGRKARLWMVLGSLACPGGAACPRKPQP